ncbi:hypothetical protein ABZ635_07250 [Nocardiopsis sp. NPDC007018]|uniref:hypothetical protein n=1 Tax=Nocardiopsis sp. NPDC007018 TaxID=3155721 RepID=UPI0033DD810E
MSENTSNSGPTPSNPSSTGGQGDASTGSSSTSSGGQTGGEQQQPVVVVDMPSFEGDVAAMRAHTSFLDTVLLPHFESLVASARAQGMGEGLVGVLAQGQEQAQSSRDAVARATDATVRLNQAVAQAYADAVDAAKNKSYYQGE